MLDPNAVLLSVYRAIDAANEQLPPQDAIGKTPNAPLYGGPGPLDSLGLITLIFAVEKQIETDFGQTVSLLAESSARGDTGPGDPFASVATLVEWLAKWLPASKAAA